VRIAVNQPYFIPYAGFFRLFDVDLFVYLDDAQFPKGGWVHRNRLTTHAGKTDWLTLHLAKHPLDTPINEILFAQNAVSAYEADIKRFKMFDIKTRFTREIAQASKYANPMISITHTTSSVLEELKMNCTKTFSSYLKIPPEVKGQDRVLRICKELGATQYVNAPGGAGLYDKAEFDRQGVELKILKPFEGNMHSIAERLAFEKPMEVRKEILSRVEFIS
jgi:hypothetical protein